MKLRAQLALLCTAGLLALIVPSHVLAQEFDLGTEVDPALSIQNFEPIAGPYGVFSVESSKTGATFNIAASFLLNYAKEPLVLVPEEGDEIPLVEQQLVGDVMFAMSFAERLEVGLAFPVYLVNDAEVNADTIEGATTGDLRLRPKFTILDPDDFGLGLGLFAQIGFPTGDDQAFTSGGGLTFRPGVIVDAKTGPFLIAANVSFDVQEEQEFANLDVGSGMRYGVGAQYDIYNDQLLFGGELFGKSTFDDFLSKKEESPFEGLVGFKARTDFGLGAELGVGGGIVPGFGSPLYRVIGGIRYAQLDGDRDGDGIRDKDDACPDEPEDRDGFEDGDGCPELDNDQDGLDDLKDDCPNEPEDKDGFEDENGCPDPDNDQDGVLDVDDKCPDEPGKPEYQGCPNPDRDGDGIPNDTDQCPDDPEDKDEYVDDDGCPDPDNDQDGILDEPDKCPEQPEDVDGFEDTDGCPDTDNDQDGILDAEDGCPNEKGPKRFNGCPGQKKVIVIGDEIRILEKVYFNTGKADIQARSFKLLNEVADVIKSNPALLKIEVQGHTDDVGGDEFNRKLSEARAKSVRDYLVGKGVKESRLVSKGYGESSPAVDIKGLKGRKLKDARSKNRRVQFLILEKQTKVIEVAPGSSPKMKR